MTGDSQSIKHRISFKCLKARLKTVIPDNFIALISLMALSSTQNLNALEQLIDGKTKSRIFNVPISI